MRRTSAVEVSIHATSPLLGTGAGGAAEAAGAPAAAGAPPAGAAAAGAGATAAGALPAGAGAVAAGAAAGGASFFSCAIALAPNARAAESAMRLSSRFIGPFPLECVGTGLAGADADDLLEVEDEDLSV